MDSNILETTVRIWRTNAKTCSTVIRLTSVSTTVARLVTEAMALPTTPVTAFVAVFKRADTVGSDATFSNICNAVFPTNSSPSATVARTSPTERSLLRSTHAHAWCVPRTRMPHHIHSIQIPYDSRLPSSMHCPSRYRLRACRVTRRTLAFAPAPQYVCMTPRMASSVTCHFSVASGSSFTWSAHR